MKFFPKACWPQTILVTFLASAKRRLTEYGISLPTLPAIQWPTSPWKSVLIPMCTTRSETELLKNPPTRIVLMELQEFIDKFLTGPQKIPNYSGGLGILAGDTLKSYADCRIPVVAVSLLYRKGYFSQFVDSQLGQILEKCRMAARGHTPGSISCKILMAQGSLCRSTSHFSMNMTTRPWPPPRSG